MHWCLTGVGRLVLVSLDLLNGFTPVTASVEADPQGEECDCYDNTHRDPSRYTNRRIVFLLSILSYFLGDCRFQGLGDALQANQMCGGYVA